MPGTAHGNRCLTSSNYEDPSSVGPLEGVALSTDANQCCVVTQLPDAIQSHFLGALDARSLACTSLVCLAWRRQAATCPELYCAAFRQRFGNRSENGWWPLHEWEEELPGRRLLEALDRQLYHQEQYERALADIRQAVAVCKSSLINSQAALERARGPAGFLYFGRRDGSSRASLAADVEHWMHELASEQATIGGLESLLAQAAGKAASIQARLKKLAARLEMLQEKARELRSEDAALLRSAVEKYALPRLRARIATTYMFYTAAHAVT